MADDGIAASEFTALSGRAGDVHVVVTAEGLVGESTSVLIRPGTDLVDAVAPEDAAAVTQLLAASGGGPALLRLREEGGSHRWVLGVSTPRPATDAWVIQFRDAHRLDPTSQLVTEAGQQEFDREAVLNEVAWLLSATPRTGKEIAVAACDLDDFSFVNEQYGPQAGDEVLRIVQGRVSDALRSGDLVARLEDDQLLVVLRGVHHLRGAIRVANKIRVAVEDPITLPVGEITQTVSVGVTLISRGESVDSVLERAEGALAMAKDAGRNTVMSSPPI